MINKNQPQFLNHTRVRRTYTGGKLLDQWQGITPGVDGKEPESWIASNIGARYAEDPNTGLSVIKNAENKGILLRDYINKDPAGILGQRHFEKFGSSLGFLAKIIDSNIRLNIQTHPTRELARKFFNSEFGKTEAWYIIDTRTIAGIEPSIFLGFKPGITKKNWVQLIRDQDIDGLLECLHRIPVKAGDVFYVDSGMPHAIGSGCMLAEIQEPTDITLRVERMSDENGPYPDEVYHQGIGFEKMFDCFKYTGYSLDNLLEKTCRPACSSVINEDFELITLLGKDTTPYFSMEKLSVRNKAVLSKDDVFSTAVVLKGEGVLSLAGEECFIGSSDELFLPCDLDQLSFINKGDAELEILFCHPPSRM